MTSAPMLQMFRKAALSALFGVSATLTGLMPAQAETFRVDDSGTIISTPLAIMRWRQPIPGRSADHTAQGDLQVNVRLNLARWLHKPVRIFMGLAPTVGSAVVSSWRSQSRLLPGSVRSGERALIYEGLVSSPLLEEALQMQLTADGRQLSHSQSLSFYFELEVLP